MTNAGKRNQILYSNSSTINVNIVFSEKRKENNEQQHFMKWHNMRRKGHQNQGFAWWVCERGIQKQPSNK